MGAVLFLLSRRDYDAIADGGGCPHGQAGGQVNLAPQPWWQDCIPAPERRGTRHHIGLSGLLDFIPFAPTGMRMGCHTQGRAGRQAWYSSTTVVKERCYSLKAQLQCTQELLAWQENLALGQEIFYSAADPIFDRHFLVWC